MKKLKTQIQFYSLFLIFVLLLTYSVLKSQESKTEQMPKELVKEVIPKILLFTDGRSVIYKGRSKSGWIEVHSFIVEGGGVIEVDAETNEITSVFYGIPKQPGPKISLEEAFEKVKIWLAQKGVSLEGWVLERKEALTMGYTFEWVKRSPEGVRLLSLMNVFTEFDGSVISFDRIDRPVKISLRPKVIKEESIKIAIKEAERSFKEKLINFKVIKQQLLVWFNRKGEQELYWEISLIGEGKEEPYKHHNQTIIWINAHTGEIVRVMW